jgi:hypothetical protein
MASINAIFRPSTITNNTNELFGCVDILMSIILNYIHNDADDNKLNKIKMLFNEYSIKFKKGFFDKFDYIQHHIPNCAYTSYYHDNFKKADDIIDIMLSYDITPGPGIFNWGYQTAHLKSLELAFKHNVLPFRTYTHCYLNNAMTIIINSKRPSYQIINAIDLFRDNGLDFNEYDVNFLVSWNPSVVKYIMSLITKSVDYIGELINSLKKIKNDHSFDDIKNIIDFIVEKVISCNTLNRQDNIGCTDLHYICSDYISLRAANLYRLPYYEYLIECMLINGADINIKDNNNLPPLTQNPAFFHIVEDKQLKIKLYTKLVAFVKDIIVNRNEALTFVDELGCFLLPDIAGVVCLHRYILQM